MAERGGGAAPLRVVSSIVEAISGRDNPEAVVDRIAAPSTSVVTLTITEKGYRIDPRTGTLNTGRRTGPGRPRRQASADRHRTDHPRPPAAARTGAGPAHRRLVRQPARQRGADRHPGPCLRRRPAGSRSRTAAGLAGRERHVPQHHGGPDGARHHGRPTWTPSNVNWASGTRRPWWPSRSCSGSSRTTSPPRRPRWEDAGALFSSDVAAWEAAKLRLLNASHSMLAYLGLAAGKDDHQRRRGRGRLPHRLPAHDGRGRAAHHHPAAGAGR